MTLASVLAAPDPDPSDHHSLLLCAGALAVVAAVLALWRTAPDAVLHLICPLGPNHAQLAHEDSVKSVASPTRGLVSARYPQPLPRAMVSPSTTH